MWCVWPKSFLQEAMIWLLVVMTVTIGFSPPESFAMLIAVQQSGVEPIPTPQHTADLELVQKVLESKIIRQRLEDLGLSPEDINAKLLQLSDDQLHQLAMEIDAMIPGGDGLGIVIALLVIAILVVILVYLLDHRIIVTKNGK